MKAVPTKNLFTLRHQPYTVSCSTCHPDTNRIVILFEKPSLRNRSQGLSVSARYKNGKYHGVMTGDVLPIVLDETVWMESPLSEGPFYVGNTTDNVIMKDTKQFPVFDDVKIASSFVNDMNMVSMGNPTYTVVDGNGILIDHEGYYTKHIIAPQQ